MIPLRKQTAAFAVNRRSFSDIRSSAPRHESGRLESVLATIAKPALGALVLLIALAAAPTAKAAIQLKSLSRLPQVADSTVQVTGDSGVIAGTTLILPKAAIAAHYDSTTRTVLVTYQEKPKAKRTLLGYGLATRHVAWARVGNAYVTEIRDGKAIASADLKTAVIDMADGRFSEWPGNLRWLEPGHIPLSIGDRSITRYDVKSGGIAWQRPIVKWTRDLEWNRTDDTLLLVAGGLHRLELTTGKGWSVEAPTHRGGMGGVLAKEFGKGLLSGLALAFTGQNVPSGGVSEEKITHGLFARPLVSGDRVFFAARQNAFAIDRVTGTVVWKAALGFEPGAMRLEEIGPFIAVLGSGRQFQNGKSQDGPEPTILLVGRESGEVVGRMPLAKGTEVRAVRWHAGAVYVVIDRKVLRCDSTLAPVAVLESSTHQDEQGVRTGIEGTFQDLVVDREALTLVTSEGRIGIAPQSLEPLATPSPSEVEASEALVAAAEDPASAPTGDIAVASDSAPSFPTSSESAMDRARQRVASWRGPTTRPSADADATPAPTGPESEWSRQGFTAQGGAWIRIDGNRVTIVEPSR